MLWWISRKTLEQTETVLMENRAEKTTSRIVPVIRIVNDGLQSVLIPSVLLDGAESQPHCPWQEHNNDVLRQYEDLNRRQEMRPWLREVHRLMKQALRRLRTQTVSPWSN